MTTGRVEYAPDYKSESERKYPDMSHVFRNIETRAECQRLQREAVEYLLSWHTERDPAKRSAAWHRMISAANDLVAFNEANPKE